MHADCAADLSALPHQAAEHEIELDIGRVCPQQIVEMPLSSVRIACDDGRERGTQVVLPLASGQRVSGGSRSAERTQPTQLAPPKPPPTASLSSAASGS